MSIVKAWYEGSAWLWLLWPVSKLFETLAASRRKRLEKQRIVNHDLPPVIVVGNISVGGTGKTPLVIELARLLQAKGMRPAIISRGYGGQSMNYPLAVTMESSVDQVGDEAVLIRRNVSCPFYVDPKRARAVQRIANASECDIIISDDGLQHYEMDRALEIIVVDGARLLGNELCLPAGPLREPKQRLREADFVVLNGGENNADAWSRLGIDNSETRKTVMQLAPSAWVNVSSNERVALAFLPVEPGAPLHAIAGIGNPQRFFATARSLGYQPLCHPFPDHYRFAVSDFCWQPGSVVIMTQKDAVKCENFSDENYWYLDIRAQLDDSFVEQFLARVENISANKQNRVN